MKSRILITQFRKECAFGFRYSQFIMTSTFIQILRNLFRKDFLKRKLCLEIKRRFHLAHFYRLVMVICCKHIYYLWFTFTVFIFIFRSCSGPRKCIGFEFAKLIIGIGLVSLLRNFNFSTCNRTQIPIKYSTEKNTLIPSSGVWLKANRL